MISSAYMGMEGPLFEREWKNCAFSVKLDQSLRLNLEDQARWMIEREADGTRGSPNSWTSFMPKA